MDSEQYQLLPPLSDEEYAALKADIRQNGVLVPIEKDEQGNILDGFHRARIIGELQAEGYKIDAPVIVRIGMSHEEKIEHGLSLNLNRRHLATEQRRGIVARLRSDGWSTRRIADKLNMSEGTVRNDLAGAQFCAPAAIKGKDGRLYPPNRPRSVIVTKAREEKKVYEVLSDPETVKRLFYKKVTSPKAPDLPKPRTEPMGAYNPPNGDAKEMTASEVDSLMDTAYWDLCEWYDLYHDAVESWPFDPNYHTNIQFSLREITKAISTMNYVELMRAKREFAASSEEEAQP